MKHTISPDRRKLTIKLTRHEQALLRRLSKECERKKLFDEDDSNFGNDAMMADFLEPLICNSELTWINPADTGDLTDAPILGILGEERPFNQEDSTIPHIVTGSNMIQPILCRWAFMSYQVRAVLEDLRDKGEAVFVA